MKTKSVYRARMTRNQAEIVKALLVAAKEAHDAAPVQPEDVEGMRQIVAVSDLIAQIDAELAQAA